MAAEAGALRPLREADLGGSPGVACGSRLFETMSKMPALARSV